MNPSILSEELKNVSTSTSNNKGLKALLSTGGSAGKLTLKTAGTDEWNIFGNKPVEQLTDVTRTPTKSTHLSTTSEETILTVPTKSDVCKAVHKVTPLPSTKENTTSQNPALQQDTPNKFVGNSLLRLEALRDSL